MIFNIYISRLSIIMEKGKICYTTFIINLLTKFQDQFNKENGMISANEQLEIITKMIETCSVDQRDQWPTNADSYTKSESICRGQFGIVRFAECIDPSFVLDGMAARKCVIKTIYLRRKFEAILSAENESKKGLAGIGQQRQTAFQLLRLHRHILMELFILTRCRHANIMHLHALFISDGGDMHIVLPRLYVLQNLIQMYRRRKKSEPIPISIIAKILRQLCAGLDFLQQIGIVHRDVQPENIFLTRNGTVKLGHFGQAKALIGDGDEGQREHFQEGCRTPIGREEFMCFEKQHNLYSGATQDDDDANGNLLDYSFPGDMWSLGVLVLAMVSYFPDEPSQKLHKNFALAMHEEQMPFIWLTVDMLQLRSRLVKSGGEELKLFLSDRLLTVRPEQRATAENLPKTPEMRKWCCGENVAQDCAFLRKNFINEVDFANQMKLETDAPNYDTLETKDIPAEFYWDETWSQMENMEFCLQLTMTGCLPEINNFKFSQPEPFFRILYRKVLAARLELTDLLHVDFEIKQAIFEFIRLKSETKSARRKIQLKSAEGKIRRQIEVEIRLPKKQNGRLRLGSQSPNY